MYMAYRPGYHAETDSPCCTIAIHFIVACTAFSHTATRTNRVVLVTQHTCCNTVVTREQSYS